MTFVTRHAGDESAPPAWIVIAVSLATPDFGFDFANFAVLAEEWTFPGENACARVAVPPGLPAGLRFVVLAAKVDSLDVELSNPIRVTLEER